MKMKKLKTNNNKSTKKSIINFIIVLTLLGGCSTMYFSNTDIGKHEKWVRNFRKVNEEFNILDIQEVECNEITCFFSDGRHVTLEGGKEFFLYKTNNKDWVEHSINYYKKRNNEVEYVPGVGKYKYEDLGWYLLKSNDTLTDEEFDRIIKLIINEL